MLGKTLLGIVAVTTCYLLVRDWVYPGARRTQLGPIRWKNMQVRGVITALPRLLRALVHNPKLLRLGIGGIFLGIAAVELHGRLPIMEWVTIAYFAGLAILVFSAMLAEAAANGRSRGDEDSGEADLSKKADFMEQMSDLSGDSFMGGGDLGGGDLGGGN